MQRHLVRAEGGPWANQGAAAGVRRGGGGVAAGPPAGTPAEGQGGGAVAGAAAHGGWRPGSPPSLHDHWYGTQMLQVADRLVSVWWWWWLGGGLSLAVRLTVMMSWLILVLTVGISDSTPGRLMWWDIPYFFGSP